MQKNLRKSSPAVGQTESSVSLRTDNTGIILDASAGFLYESGKTKDQLVGSSLGHFAIEFNAPFTSDLNHHSILWLNLNGTPTSFTISRHPDAVESFILTRAESKTENGPMSGNPHWTTLFSVISSNPRPAVVYDLVNGRIFWGNTAFLALYGFSQTELQNKTVFELASSGTNAEEIQALHYPVNGQQLVSTHRSRHQQCFKVRLSPTVLSLGDQSAGILYIEDITAEWKRSRSAALYEQIQEALNSGKSFKESISNITSLVREFTGWELAEFWLFSKENRFSHIEAYSVAPGEINSSFLEDSLNLRVDIEVIRSKPKYHNYQPFWVEDLASQPDIVRAEQAVAAGIQTSFVLPFLEKGELVGGIMLFSKEKKGYDREMVEVLEHALKTIPEQIIHRKTFEQLESFFTLSGDLLCITDRNGRFARVNPAFAKLLGYTEQELLGRSYYSFVHDDDKEKATQGAARILANEKLQDFELRIRCKNEDYLVLSWSAVFSTDHQVLIAAARDITSVQRVQRDVQQREEQYRALAENVPLLIHKLDRNLRLTYTNKAVQTTFNLKESDLLGKTPGELGMNKEAWMRVENRCRAVFESGVSENFTLRMPSESGSGHIYNMLLTIAPEKDVTGRVQSVIIIANEISPIVKAQEELIYKDKLLSLISRITHDFLKEDNYRNILENALKNLGLAANADRVYIFENRKDDNNTLYSSQTYEWCSDSCVSLMNNPYLRDLPLSYQLSKHEIHIQESSCISRITRQVVDDSLRNLLTSVGIKSLLFCPIFVQGAFWGFIGMDDCKQERIWREIDKDILKTFASSLASAVERRKAEEIVLESEARFKNMADTAPVMIWVSDRNDKTIYVNKTWNEFTGLGLKDVSEIKWSELVHPEDASLAIHYFDEMFSQRLPVTLEYRMKAASGQYRWIIDQSIPRFLSDGTFLGYIGTVVDIHDRKVSEEKVSYQARVMQEITDAIIATDLQFNVTTWNSGAENIHGITAEEIVGHKVDEFIDYEYRGESRQMQLTHLFNYGYWSGEISYLRPDGRQIHLFSSISFVTDQTGQHIGLVEVQRDITEKRKAEEALRNSEERYRTLIDALSEGLSLINREGEVITCNKSVESIFDDKISNIIGTSIYQSRWKCIREDGTDMPLEEVPAVQVLQTGKPVHNRVLGIHRANGELVWISANAEPLYYSSERTTPDAVVVSFNDITARKIAEMELKRSATQLKEYSDRINIILESITDGFIAIDNDFRVFLWNKVLEIITGINTADAVGRKVNEVFPDLEEEMLELFSHSIRSRMTLVDDFYSKRFNTWFEITAFPSVHGLFIYLRDINNRKRQESLLALEKEVLELNARPQTSLQYNTEVLIGGIEKIFPGTLCSVLTLRADGKTIETLAAPSLPAEYCAAINGVVIGPRVGSCGTAMYLKQNIIVSDIENDELWADFKELALRHNLRACWSFPILSSQNRVLASLAIYSKTRNVPTREELTVIERAVNLLRLIIENKHSEEKIKISNERYLLATMATNDAIWDWDVATNTMYWGEGFHGLFGYKAGTFQNDLGMWESSIHPADRDRVLHSIHHFIDSQSQQVWQEEYRFKKADGKYVLVSDRGFLIYNQQGQVSRMVGSMQDITEKREMEKKLLRQELNKQKLVAQAVVDAQEKERSLIGKELHDNINQILSTAKLYLEVARNDEKERISLIDMSTQGISDAINEIRTISRSLVPSSIGDLGLVESIQDLVESIKLTRKLNVEFYYHPGIDDLMSEQQKLMIFRIAQEQVNNVMKHAQAKNLIIELFAEDNMINISISDDGKGFDPEQVRHKKGVGLFNITSRAELFNGKVSINSAPGKGCTLNINIPISNL